MEDSTGTVTKWGRSRFCGQWEYHRVGEGAAGCEVLWDIRTHDSRLCLEIFGRTQKTLAVTLDADGTWRGRWLCYEKMPIELSPLPVSGNPEPSLQTLDK